MDFDQLLDLPINLFFDHHFGIQVFFYVNIYRDIIIYNNILIIR